MYRFALVGSLLFAVAACAPTQKDIDELDTLSDINCTVRPGNCSYINSPIRVVDNPITLPRRPYQFFPLATSLRFTDARSKEWVAPPGTLTDGASIPPFFVSIVGSPTAPEYVNAAAVHDAYCGIGNEAGANYHNGRWEDVHRMFYDALVASGTPELRAQIMFAAVWLGGPRWNIYYNLNEVPVARRQQAMREAKRYVEREKPSLRQLERKLMQIEVRMLRAYPGLYPFASQGAGKLPVDIAELFEVFQNYDEYSEDYEYEYGEGYGEGGGEYGPVPSGNVAGGGEDYYDEEMEYTPETGNGDRAGGGVDIDMEYDEERYYEGGDGPPVQEETAAGCVEGSCQEV